MGIKNIIKTPTQPKGLSFELDRKIAHMYSIGAGYMVLRYLKSYFLTLDKSNVEYAILKDYFDNLDAIEKHQGHIITTHMNMLLMKDELIQTYQIIVDEDILKTAFSINQVTFEDISRASRCHIFNTDVKKCLSNLSKTKLIIMSATAEPSIYRAFLPNRRIITHECKKG